MLDDELHQAPAAPRSLGHAGLLGDTNPAAAGNPCRYSQINAPRRYFFPTDRSGLSEPMTTGWVGVDTILSLPAGGEP